MNTFTDARKNPQVYFTYLLFHFALAIRSNNHGISALTTTMDKNRRYALGIFPKVACLLNHSCNPNTAVVVQNDEQVTYATKQIKPGEEICHIYNCHFADTPFEKRQKEMFKNYHFKCACLACMENYPIYEELPEEFSNDEYNEATEKAMFAYQAKDFKKASKYLAMKLKIASENLHEPHQVFIRDRAAFIQCIWQQYGTKTYL